MDSNGKKVDITERTYKFGVEIIKLVKSSSKGFSSSVLLGQLVRSGTSIGANVEEAQNASSKNDFTYRVGIALREARETRYWLRLLVDSGTISGEKILRLIDENTQLVRILSSIVKNSKSKD